MANSSGRTSKTARLIPEQWASVASQRADRRPFEDMFTGAFLPLMFMEATSGHGFDPDQAESRRRVAYGTLAEVTASGGRRKLYQQPRREEFWFAGRSLRRQTDLR